MDSKKQKSISDVQKKINDILQETGASEHNFEFLSQYAAQFQQIFTKIQDNCQTYFQKMNELDEVMQEDIKQFQMQSLSQAKAQLEELSEGYNSRCQLQEETLKNLQNVQMLNNQILGSREQWNQQ